MRTEEDDADHLRTTLISHNELAAHFRDALDTLADLSSYVGAGMGDKNTTADEYADRIRWGIDHIVNVMVQRCADVVEEQSKTPAHASLGRIKRAILDLKAHDCANCAGTGLVCENHYDRPWDGHSDGENACGCGAGMNCPVCSDEPSYEMMSAGYDATRLEDGTPQFAKAGFCICHARTIYVAMRAARFLKKEDQA